MTSLNPSTLLMTLTKLNCPIKFYIPLARPILHLYPTSLRTSTAMLLQPPPVTWWRCPSFLTPTLPFNFTFKNPPHPFLFPLITGSYPVFLTGVGSRAGTATPLPYLYNLGSTMWSGVIMDRWVECPPHFYLRVVGTGQPYHPTPLPWDLPYNFTHFSMTTVIQ